MEDAEEELRKMAVMMRMTRCGDEREGVGTKQGRGSTAQGQGKGEAGSAQGQRAGERC